MSASRVRGRGRRNELTSCARLVALVDGRARVRGVVLGLLGRWGGVGLGEVGDDGEVGAVEGAAVQHERGLGRGGLVKGELGSALLFVEVYIVDLAAEPGQDEEWNVSLSLLAPGRRGRLNDTELGSGTYVKKSLRCVFVVVAEMSETWQSTSRTRI